MKLKYELQFFDYWHISSGISGGAKLDSFVTKDNDNIPFIGGKTIKGLVREMGELLNDKDFIKNCFGSEGIENGKCYFANVVLDKDTKKTIIENQLQDNLYDKIASTRIGQKNKRNEIEGIAVDDSLREIEITIPLILFGEILDIPTKEDYDNLVKSLKLIKRVGLNRNRGLGRCQFLNFTKED